MQIRLLGCHAISKRKRLHVWQRADTKGHAARIWRRLVEAKCNSRKIKHEHMCKSAHRGVVGAEVGLSVLGQAAGALLAVVAAARGAVLVRVPVHEAEVLVLGHLH